MFFRHTQKTWLQASFFLDCLCRTHPPLVPSLSPGLESFPSTGFSPRKVRPRTGSPARSGQRTDGVPPPWARRPHEQGVLAFTPRVGSLWPTPFGWTTLGRQRAVDCFMQRVRAEDILHSVPPGNFPPHNSGKGSSPEAQATRFFSRTCWLDPNRGVLPTAAALALASTHAHDPGLGLPSDASRVAGKFRARLHFRKARCPLPIGQLELSVTQARPLSWRQQECPTPRPLDCGAKFSVWMRLRPLVEADLHKLTHFSSNALHPCRGCLPAAISLRTFVKRPRPLRPNADHRSIHQFDQPFVADRTYVVAQALGLSRGRPFVGRGRSVPLHAAGVMALELVAGVAQRS